MKRVFLVLLAVIVFVSAALSTYAAPAKITLRVAWWGNPTRDARTLKVIQMYMEKNPNVVIEPEYTSWAGYWDKIAAQAAANNLPDVMQHDYAYLLQYVQKNLLLNLSPSVSLRKIDLSGVDPTYTSGGKVKGRYYGISLGTNAVCLVYDPAVLQKAGLAPPKNDWTWADFEKMAAEIYQKTGVQTLPIFTTDPRVGFDNWIRQTGKAFFNPKDGASLGFTDEKLLTEFFDLQLRLLKAGVLVKPEVAFVTTTPAEDPFGKGNSWVQFVWSNQVIATQEGAKRPISIALLPRIANSKRPGTYLKPSMFFSVSRSTKYKDEAIKFINYFINDIEANKVLLAERGIPIVPAVRDALKEMLDPVNKQVFDYIDLVGNKNASPIDPPDPPNAGEVLKLFRTITQEVLYGAITPKEAAARFIKEANEILAKNRQG
ncbi:MAG: ABC transporter substrate-binding protein [Firmicutes bacterium]|nr:ABC transporter substrate-binding protein [Bacillota bacterium]